MRPWILCLLSSLLPLTAAGGSLFPDEAEVNGARFPKMGEHRTTYKVLFKLYDACLLYTSDAADE